jgi:hypothetical protein
MIFIIDKSLTISICVGLIEFSCALGGFSLRWFLIWFIFDKIRSFHRFTLKHRVDNDHWEMEPSDNIIEEWF